MDFPNLQSALRSIGKGYVFVGDPAATGPAGLRPLGATEGEVKVAFNQEFNDLKFPEYTGPAVHERRLTGENVTVTIPLILGDPALLDDVSPVGATGGGFSSQQPVKTTSLVIFPETEIRNGITYTAGTGGAAGTWTPAAPRNAVWIWRGHFVRPGMNYKQADGGKVIVETTFQAMYDGTRPEGHKLYTIGDPTAQGITNLAI
ncbi:MAG TPA: hypothetical protein VHG28_05415 [Longimicrobiaceae bacterium]|nr:hypothetical protein [Longimicrobiaceae bacterium]